jgi:hypothetical protein
MTIDFKKKEINLREVITIQEVDELLEWLLENPKTTINLADCTHIHLAALQTLASAKRKVTAWPQDNTLKRWIQPLLEN